MDSYRLEIQGPQDEHDLAEYLGSTMCNNSYLFQVLLHKQTNLSMVSTLKPMYEPFLAGPFSPSTNMKEVNLTHEA